MRLNEINSNLIFLFPIYSSLVKEEWIYFLLSVSIFIASSFFHFCKERNVKRSYIRFSRYSDIAIATSSYAYMYYFVYSYVTQGQFIFCSLLLLTILMFFFGKSSLGKRNNVHSYFHIAIGLVAGFIPLFG